MNVLVFVLGAALLASRPASAKEPDRDCVVLDQSQRLETTEPAARSLETDTKAFVSLAAADEAVQMADIHGKSHTPLIAGARKAVVLLFVSPFCPTANTLTPEANKIEADYGDRFAFYFVEADAGLAIADARKHAETLGIKAPLLLDPQQLLVKRTRARTTPEAVVLGAKGETLYQGRINDLYVNQTRKLKEPKTHDLRAALDAIAAGRPVAVPSVKAVGCSITLMP
jgi:hypothetical protein